MIKPEQIPEAVIRQFATWQFPKCTDKLMRSMLADALNAWPGMGTVATEDHAGVWRQIILPLTESGNE